MRFGYRLETGEAGPKARQKRRKVMGNIVEADVFSCDYYKELCERMALILQQEKELAAEKETVREELLAYAGGERMEHGIKVSFVPGSDRVDYKAIVESLEVPGFVIARHSKVGDGHWRVTKY